jgi:BirA family transcriptional regulator, biotin operon repressor / biotin---[acetyl-CoA-carboxylase] ligase
MAAVEWPPLDPDRLEALGLPLIGRNVQVWNRIASTNDAALQAARTPANAGLVVLAEEQSAGRGQRGRVWLAPPRASILMSVVLFPPESLSAPAALVSLTAVAVACALERFVPGPLGIKWPNDIYASGRKVGGILVERAALRNSSEAVGTVIGIGLNVHAAPPDSDDLRATALDTLAGCRLDRTTLVSAILTELDAWYEIAVREGQSQLLSEWRKRACLVGETIRVETTNGPITGTLISIDPLDGISLRTDSGLALSLAPTEIKQLRSPL